MRCTASNGVVRSGWSATFALVALSFAATAQTSDPHDPPAPGDITGFTRGIAWGIAESSYDQNPQIESIVQIPAPRIIPIQKLPIDPEERERFRPAPRRYASFDGLSNTGWVPPDCTLAVGPNHVLQTVNMKIAWYDKGGVLQYSNDLSDAGSPGFFEGVGAKGFTFDPKCFYDDIDGRFVVVVFEVYGSTESWIDLAISDDDDPNGTWYKYRTDSVTTSGSNTYWVDYPGAGYDARAIYVTGNLFGLNTGGFLGTKYRIFDKTPLLTGGAATWADLVDTGSASVQVAECHANPRNPLFVSVNNSTSIKIQAVKNVLTNPSLTSTTVAISSFSAPPSAPELGGGLIDTLDGRIMNAEFLANKLVAAHGVNTGDGRSLARWYQFITNNWPAPGTTVTLDQSGSVDLGAGIHTYFPGISRRTGGDIGLCFAYSSANEYAGIGVAVHRSTDGAGKVGMVKRARLGAGSASGRWGDYFDCCNDPADSSKFWGVGEYPNWATHIVEFEKTYTPPATGLLYSTRAFASVGGIAFEAGDIVHLDTATGVTSMYFDISDVLASPTPNLDAFAVLADGSILISFEDTVTIPGLSGGPNGNKVEDEDIVQFIPTTLGEATAGSWSFYFDGSDVGLNVAAEDIDALAVDGSGNLWVSFVGAWDVGGGMTGQDEDVLQFTPTTLGASTSGTWSWILMGRDPDVKMGSAGEDTDALDYSVATGKLTLSTDGDFQVPVAVKGQNRDLVQFTPTALGFDPAGTWAVVFDGDVWGLADDDIDGIEILE